MQNCFGKRDLVFLQMLSIFCSLFGFWLSLLFSGLSAWTALFSKVS